MNLGPLPAPGAPDKDRLVKIGEHRATLGRSLAILGHHYQRPAIVEQSDLVGDSFLLAKKGAELSAENIVFCGVRFMAEAAAILAGKNQTVYHPDAGAGCPMADMATSGDVEEAWQKMTAVLGKEALIPLVYMNSNAALKSFVGEKGGTVCTSSNAGRAFAWAQSQGKKIFFLPDEHLGRNTSHALGIPEEDIALYDFMVPHGGLSADQIKQAQVILWSGHCHVHVLFRPDDVTLARREYPGCKVIVHPECEAPVVGLADTSGSTEKIVATIAEASPGSTIVVGTEINLVGRMAATYPDRRVVPLRRSLCPNMYRITPAALEATLGALVAGTPPPPVTVAERTRSGARLALERMLELP